MTFPSLMYNCSLSELPEETICEASDAKNLIVDSLLGEKACNKLLLLCSFSEREKRQKLFNHLSQEGILSVFNELHRRVIHMDELYRAYKNTHLTAKRNYIFVYIMREYHAFARVACRIGGDGGFADGIASCFIDLCSTQDFSLREKLACEVAQRLETVRKGSLTVAGEKTVIGVNAKNSYAAQIEKCAETMGIEIKDYKTPARELCTDICESQLSLYKNEMGFAESFAQKYMSDFKPEILLYRDELNFYLSIERLTSELRKADIAVSFPLLSQRRIIRAEQAYDVTLLHRRNTSIVPNDIQFTDDESFFYLTGANGGGKTTYLRTVGIYVLFAQAGCPTACKSGEYGGINSLFTHFPEDEGYAGESRFQNEERRAAYITQKSDNGSLVLLNETFSATTEEKASEMTRKLSDNLRSNGTYGIYVTHIRPSSDDGIPYLVVEVDRSDENRRTYKVVRQSEMSASYAADILKKYSLDKDSLTERFK